MNGAVRLPMRAVLAVTSMAVFAAVCLAMLTVGLAIFATEASAQGGPSISVDEATNLVDEQLVEISVSAGSTQNLYIVRQCLDGAATADDCDPAMLGYVESGHGNGAPFTFLITVFRELDLAGGPSDCAVVDCVLALTPYGQEFSVAASVPVSFDPAVPAKPRPTLMVTPSTDLMDAEIITVEGSGFAPFERLYLRQCGPDAADNCANHANDAAELDGTFQTEFRVARLLSGGGHGLLQTDCAFDACSIVVSRNSRSAAPAPISFDPDSPTEPGPVVKVRPRKDLKDGAAVSVTITAREGEQLMPYASVLQCGLTDTGLIDGGACRYIGNFHQNQGRSGEGEGEFPSTTVGPAPATTEPADVPEGSPATTGPPATQPPATEPPSPTPFQSPATTVGPGGQPEEFTELSGTVQARRSLFIEGHGLETRRVDCVETKCVIAVQSEGAEVWRSQVLKFDPASSAPKAIVKIKARNGLESGKAIQIQIRKTRAVAIEIRQCPRTATTHLDHRCQRIGNHFRGDRHGGSTPILGLAPFTVRATPVRFVGVGNDQVDCRERKACDLRVFGTDGPMRRLLINFADDGSPLTDKLRLAERSDLKHREPVAIKVGRVGRGWNLQQCPNRESNFGCTRIPVRDKVETNGITRGTVSLLRVVGGVDCATSETRCQLRLTTGHRETDRVLLRFDPDTPGDPDPVFEVKPRRGLVHDQSVVVTGRNTGGGFQTLQCVRGDDGEHAECRYLQSRRAPNPDDLPGTRQVAVRVLRTIGEVDCAESAGRCRLQMQGGHGGTALGVVNLRFDADAPQPPGFEAKVHPRKGLADGQPVKVTYSNANYVGIRQCAIVDGELLQASCTDLNISDQSRDGNERSGTVRVKRLIGPRGVETLFDCADTPRSCALVFSSHGNHGQAGVQQISLVFNRNAEPIVPDPPETTGSLFLEIGEGPVELGSLVTVRGEGFEPGNSLFVLPCTENIADVQSSCDVGALTPVVVGGEGTFTVELQFNGCGAERCRLAAGDAGGIDFGFTEPFDVVG